MRQRRPSLFGVVIGTWRRFLPSPTQAVRSALSPRRLFRRFRLRWVVLFVAALVIWLIAALTEPAPPQSAFATPAAAQLEADGGEAPPPAPVRGTVASSPELAARFFRKVAAAVQAGIQTGRLDLSITEAEATSALEVGGQLVEIRQVMSTLSPEELNELDTPEEIRRAVDARHARPPSGFWGRVRYALNPRLRFRQGQVRFRPDGRVLVSGYAHAWSRRVPVHMDAVPTLEDGRLSMDFRETRLGRLRVPSWVLGGPAKLVTLVLGLGKDYASLQALEVADGRLSLSGRVRLPSPQ